MHIRHRPPPAISKSIDHSHTTKQAHYGRPARSIDDLGTKTSGRHHRSSSKTSNGSTARTNIHLPQANRIHLHRPPQHTLPTAPSSEPARTKFCALACDRRRPNNHNNKFTALHWHKSPWTAKSSKRSHNHDTARRLAPGETKRQHRDSLRQHHLDKQSSIHETAHWLTSRHSWPQCIRP